MAIRNSSSTASAAVSRPARSALFWTSIGYGLMLLGSIGALILIRSYGATLVAPPAAVVTSFGAATAARSDVLLHVLVALTAVIVTGLILARCFAYLGQPPVIGEVVAGIVLGPSLLGVETSALILPPGLDLKVISPTLFAMMVLMALVTTIITAPLLQWLLPQTAAEATSTSGGHG
jgi:hypothetical protein